MDRIGFHRHFRRVLRSFQLYPPGSPVRDEAIEAIQESLSGDCRPACHGLSLAFLEEGAYLDGSRIEAGAEGGRLDRELFELGVLEIRFLPGVNRDELVRFFEPLAKALLGQLNPVDEDLSVLLWEADLSHIACFLYENQEELTQDVMDAESIAPQGSPDLGEYLDTDVRIGEPGVPGKGMILNEAERLEILAAYRREEREEHPLKYGLILLELMRGESDADECGRLLESFETYLGAVAASGRFALLRRIRDAVEPALNVSPAASSTLTRAAAWFLKPALYLGAVRGVSRDGRDLEAARAIISDAPSAVLPNLVAAVQDPSATVPAALREAIDARLAEDRAGLELCLKSDDPMIRQTALRLVRPGPEEIRWLRPVLRDSDPAMRKLAVDALSRSNGTNGLSCLFEALADRDEGVRVAAANALGAHGGRRALEPLLRVLISREFEARGYAEKRAFFKAAAVASPGEVWPVLARMAERRRILPSRKHEERRQAALEALVSLNPEIRQELRRRWSGSRVSLLRQFEALAERTTGSGVRVGDPAEPEEAA